ncbi:MAG: rubrerythrin [Bacillota bacterium]
MENHNNEMNPRDCLQRAWVNSMELVRDFEMYSKNLDDDRVASFFKELAEKQGLQAHELRELYNQYDSNSKK